MPFNEDQIKCLRAGVRTAHVRERDVEGKTLRYLEGWFVVAEANRIFGHDGWDREIVASECVWRKVVDGLFAVAYLTRVRVTVRADGQIVSREGVGAGQFMAPTMGLAHERAAKAAETDATKRALVTFGGAFGLLLNRDGRAAERRLRGPVRAEQAIVRAGERAPRVIRLDGTSRSDRGAPGPNDRDLASLAVREACVVCGDRPARGYLLEKMHMDEVTRSRTGADNGLIAPLCFRHMNSVREAGDEAAWWDAHGIDPVAIARDLLDTAGRAGDDD